MLLLLILALGLVAQFFLPWWIIALIAFGMALWRARTAGHAFLSGFLGIGLGWLGTSLFIHLRTEAILTAKVAQLFSLPGGVLLVITALVGALVGGMAALSGYFCRKAVERTTY
jgi:hypothetical protein